MTDLQKGITTLIRSAVTAKSLPLPAGFSLEDAYPQLVRHQILALGYDGAVRCGVSKQLPIMQKMFMAYCQILRRSESQLQAVEQLCNVFEDRGIHYMPLKGCNMKTLYPRSELRQMGDADILIREAQYPAAVSVMEQLGYAKTVADDHAYGWKNDALYLELHRRPIPMYTRDYYDYFGNGWQNARLVEGCRYALSPEDEFIYLFVHYAKHYRLGGIGCRQATDLWVFRHAYPRLDMAYIEAEMEKIQLTEFYQNTMRTLSVWFEDAPGDEVTELITDYVFSSGSWGTRESVTLSQSLEYKLTNNIEKNLKGRSFLHLFFPSAKTLRYRYTVLQKCPWLLPAVWPMRWVDVVFHRRKNIKRRIRDVQTVTDEKTAAYEAAMRAVGMNYPFEDENNT